MVTVDEETQAKEFLKRAEIRTMKKDLAAMREVDALKERDKIVTMKTLEEQLAEKRKSDLVVPVKDEKAAREEVLGKNENEEKIAEKDLKKYATEEERQQIFLLESQRLSLEKRVDAIDKEKDPALKLEKNKILLQKRDWHTKLNAVLDQQKKLEEEEAFIVDKEKTTAIPSQRKGLEQSRADLDIKIQDVEKKRWEVEKQIENTDKGVAEVDKSSALLITEKNEIRDKILGLDKSLRDIYSVVVAREEEKRRGQSQEQLARKEAAAKLRAQEQENVRREQWSGAAHKKQQQNSGQTSNATKPAKERVFESFKDEEGQRERFLQDVGHWSDDKSKSQPQVRQQEPLAPPPVPMKK